MPHKAAYIISLKFSPGLKKEFEVLGENIRKNGVEVKYLVSKNYSRLGEVLRNVEYIETKDSISGLIFDTFKYLNCKKIMPIFCENPPVFVCFYNPHTINPNLAHLIKKNFGFAILSLYLHDPYKPDKSPYGLAKGIYISLAEFIQGLTVKYMDYVISPSEYSAMLFRTKHLNFKGQNYIAPLLVPDQRVMGSKARKYFSIVGGAHLATGHDSFIELVNYVAEKNINCEFALISSNNLSAFLDKLTEKGKNILKVINKKIITDSEINEVMRESYAVFRLDREVTQSGVIPVSCMNGTPVIARDIPGLTQHIKHEYNGYITSLICTPADLVKGMDYVKEHFSELSRNARKSYEEIWAEWNFDKYYGWLIELLNKQL